MWSFARFNTYNIYTVYKRVPVHWTLVLEIRDTEQQDRRSFPSSSRFEPTISNGRGPRWQRPLQVEKQTDSVRLVSLSLIVGSDHNPAVVFLPSRVPRYSTRGQGKSRRIARVPTGRSFLVPILNSARYAAKIQTRRL